MALASPVLTLQGCLQQILMLFTVCSGQRTVPEESSMSSTFRQHYKPLRISAPVVLRRIWAWF